jgi:hypothetical protein
MGKKKEEFLFDFSWSGKDRAVLYGVLVMIFVMAFLLIQFPSPQPVHAEDICSGLDIEGCFNNPLCKGIYGTLPCSGDNCGGIGFSFLDCVEIPLDELEKGVGDMILCENTGGIWERDEFSEPGRCECSRLYIMEYEDFKKVYREFGGYYFIENRGCISSQDLCIEHGGIWEKSKKYYYKDTSKVMCDSYASSEWKPDLEVCMIFDESRFSGFDYTPPQCFVDGDAINIIREIVFKS